MKRRKPIRSARDEERAAEALRLEKAQLATGRAPMTHGGHESMDGFRQPRMKWHSRTGRCQRCNGDGSYVEKGVLRVCRCS